MTLLRLLQHAAPIHIVSSETLQLRHPVLEHFEQWRTLRETSRDFLKSWEPSWPEDDLTRIGFRRRVMRYDQERRHDQTYPVFLFRQPDDVLLGGIVLSNVRRGVVMTGTVGYWIGAPYARQGWMRGALTSFCDFAFQKIGLERLQAAAQPQNLASLKLLRRLGFREEGLARDYLRICGKRCDHLLFGLLPDDLKKSKTF